MSGQSGGQRLRLCKLNEQLTCRLCGGYFIDATTIIECLHSFCRSCIVKYLESNKYCPICEVQVHKSRPLLNIRPDHTLQDIVYKLVPGCYQNEMRCRREFYAKHPEACSQSMSPEARGEPTESHIYSPDESLSLSLEYFSPCAGAKDPAVVKDLAAKPLLRRYLRCPAAVTVFHLQKLIRAKYGLSDAHRVDVMYKEEPLCSSYTLMDVMYIYHWRRKVPLHLSYRIFESSPKRMRLSEDNATYKSSLLRAGIDSVDPADPKSPKREWKEVQLKISETGVMSITDISSPHPKRTGRLDDLQDSLEQRLDPTDQRKDTCADSKPPTESEAPREAPRELSKSAEGAEGEKTEKRSDCGEKKGPEEGAERNEGCARAKEVERADTEATERTENNNVEPKAVLKAEEVAKGAQEASAEQKQISKNNNNTIGALEGKPEGRKQAVRAGAEAKAPNAGSKIDALSVKLQFQPKVGQTNNTYAKKPPKEKKTQAQATRKTEAKVCEQQTKNSLDAACAKGKSNCASLNKPSVVCASKGGQKNSGSAEETQISVSTASVQSGVGPERSEKETEKNSQDSGRSGASNQKTSGPSEQKVAPGETEGAQRTQQTPNASAQKVQFAPQTSEASQQSTDSVSIGLSVSAPSLTQTFPYTVQDIVNNVMKGSLKNLATSGAQKLQNASVGSVEVSMAPCPGQDTPQFLHAPSVSLQHVSASVKSDYPPPIVSTAKQTSSKVNFEITGVYSVPPCPDAIPISLMKPTVRKNEVITKGSNLNDICAKIGASGSKINDICAKIGENSKEKSKIESRSKSEIPDLLKIGRKTCSLVVSSHATSIPNVPVYTPSNSAATENKSVYSSVKDSLRATSLVSSSPVSVSAQKASGKKQSQAVGYKTLRDPPRCWNPTLSKNNYIAVKNQSKELQNQPALSERAKPIQSKPAKIFKMRNMPRYLGNPASGVKPMYGIGNEAKEKEQQTNASKSAQLSMMKIDPKTLSPIVSTVNSPIVSPPPYSPGARSYQSALFGRDMCRSTGSPISPKNSPVNMLSTNPFIPSPTPNTNPRLIYSHFPPPFPDASRFPNPLIRSPIGIPPPSAFHSSLPPSINKLYQRSSYLPQNAAFPGVSQPPTIQRIPASTYSSPKSPKTTSLTAISPTSFGVKAEGQLAGSSAMENVLLMSGEGAAQEDLNVFNLSKSGGQGGAQGNFGKEEEAQSKSEPGGTSAGSTAPAGTQKSEQTVGERKEEEKEGARGKEETKASEKRRSAEKEAPKAERKPAQLNGDAREATEREEATKEAQKEKEREKEAAKEEKEKTEEAKEPKEAKESQANKAET